MRVARSEQVQAILRSRITEGRLSVVGALADLACALGEHRINREEYEFVQAAVLDKYAVRELGNPDKLVVTIASGN